MWNKKPQWWEIITIGIAGKWLMLRIYKEFLEIIKQKIYSTEKKNKRWDKILHRTSLTKTDKKR